LRGGPRVVCMDWGPIPQRIQGFTFLQAGGKGKFGNVGLILFSGRFSLCDLWVLQDAFAIWSTTIAIFNFQVTLIKVYKSRTIKRCRCFRDFVNPTVHNNILHSSSVLCPDCN
jgi:hypothetical protein